MRSAIWFIISGLAGVAAIISIVLDSDAAALTCTAVALVALILAYRAVALQLRTIHTGMDLLRSQDFASRLRHVGQREADDMVDLYNALITGMKAERLRTEEQNNFLIKLVEASPMGIAICDFDGKIVSTNEAFDRLSSPQLADTLASLAYDESTTLRQSGGQILRCSRQYFMDHGFRRPFYLVERLTDEIINAEKDIFHKIIRTMGHEVNNTIGGVISVLETIADIHRDDSVIAEVVGSCHMSCTRLGEFVRGYSDIAKLPEPSTEPTGLGALLDESLPFLRKMAPAGITVDVEHDGGETPAMVDPMLIQRVLVNAVKNSVESIGSNPGHITLRATGRHLEIIDDGPGIAPEVADRLFTPFFSTKQPDRGLGLMLIADILRRQKPTSP